MSSLLDDVAVHLFRGSFNTRPVKVLTLAEALNAIQDGTYGRPVQRLRALLQAGRKADYDRTKRNLDAVTFGGIFSPTRAKAHLVRHSGLILVLCHTGNVRYNTIMATSISGGLIPGRLLRMACAGVLGF